MRSGHESPMSKGISKTALSRSAFVIVLMGLLLLPSLAFADGSDTDAFRAAAQKGLGVAAALSFGAGFIASLTPCVFPMVPITVAIFGATETTRGRGMALSAIFVLGIATLFVPLGVLSALSGKLMGSALSLWWVNVAIAALFTALAASMFGAFEMTLPSGLANRLSTVGGIGFKGAFILGLVMGLIAAPCTGPFLTGMVTWIATTRNVHVGAMSMFLFAMGLGVPFFAAGGLAVSLPKGGAWMLGIKWASGVALAYMASKYLRDALPAVRALTSGKIIYGIIAAVLFAVGLGLGTVHILAERRKSKIAHLSKPMKLASIVPAVAGAFMLFSWFDLPHTAATIHWTTQEETARTEAAASKKPIIVDFGAEWCTACKELDHKTWIDPRVQAEASRFVAIKVDASNDDSPEIQRLQEKYKVVGLPTVVVFDSAGQERMRFNEFVPPDKMVEAISSVD